MVREGVARRFSSRLSSTLAMVRRGVNSGSSGHSNGVSLARAPRKAAMKMRLRHCGTKALELYSRQHTWYLKQAGARPEKALA